MANPKVLLIDDDEILRGIYESNFREEGFDVEVASDGKEAWGRLAVGDIPDVILTGILMPNMGGFEFIEKLKSDPRLKEIPVAICSHRGLPQDQKQADDLGVNDFIIQGTTSPPEVVRRVRAILHTKPGQYTVAIDPNKYNAQRLAELLSKQQGVTLPKQSNEIILNLEADKEPGNFKVRIS